MIGTAAEIDAVPFCMRVSVQAWRGLVYSKVQNKKCNIFYKMLHFGKPPYIIYICGMAQAEKKINFFFKTGVKFCRKAPKYSV